MNLQESIDSFLRRYNNKNIAIYGTGLNAERVVNSVSGYNFTCIISNDKSLLGTDFLGKKVVSLKDALIDSDIILIAAIPSATRIVFERIRNDVPPQIKIYDLSGNQLNAPRIYEKNIYWNVKYEDLIIAIDKHEIISFDVFDTLLMRRCLYPSTILKILKDYAYTITDGFVVDFYNIRRESENRFYTENLHPSIYEIYDRINKTYNIPVDICNVLLNKELELENKYICRREDIYKAYCYAMQNKKKIFITSDMYLTKSIIDSMLHSNGIIGYSELLVSCEYGSNKASGRLFDVLKKKAGNGNILHIGDNVASDIEGAQLTGIDSFRILSGVELLLNSSASYVIGKVDDIWDEVLLGEILASLDIFNSPFLLGKNKGKVFFDSIENMSKFCFLPVTLGYMSWLIDELRNKKNDIVLFVSRDGFFLNEIYEKIRDNHDELILPKSVYFYSSRKAMADIIPINEEGIKTLCYNFDQYRKIDILNHIKKIFGITFENNIDYFIDKKYDEIDNKELMEAVLNEKSKIFDRAEKNRKRYLKYLKTLHLDNYDNIFVVDLIAQGSARYGLSSLCKREVTLLALGTTSVPNPFIRDVKMVQSMYGQVVTGVGSAIGSMFNLLELIYASKDGQVVGFSEVGETLFDESTKYNNLLLENVQKSILSFLYNLSDHEWFSRVYSTKFIDGMLGVLNPEYSDVSSDVIEMFDFYDPLDEKNERFNVLTCVRGE